MPPPLIRYVPQRVTLERPVEGYPTAQEAHEALHQNRTETLRPGTYRVTQCRRNKAHWHDHQLDDGYYYRVKGEQTAWVRQNELVDATS